MQPEERDKTLVQPENALKDLRRTELPFDRREWALTSSEAILAMWRG